MFSSSLRRSLYSSAVIIAAVLLAQASALRAQVGFNQFEFGPHMDAVYAITAGPDDALWLVVYNGAGGYYEIGRMSLTGAVTSFPLPQYNEPLAITLGPDGALWFPLHYVGAGGSGVDSIGRITTAGAITLYPLSNANTLSGAGGGITAGSDGALWFTETTYNIGRITTGGTITQYPLPGECATVCSYQDAIVTGSDGALWFTDNFPGTSSDPNILIGNIGRMTTTGVATIYPIPSTNYAGSIVAGPDGALWFTEPQGGIGRIATDGSITEYINPSYSSQWIASSGGYLWFNEPANVVVGRMSTAGELSGSFPAPLGSDVLTINGITPGPAGTLWIAGNANTNIGWRGDIAQLVSASAKMTASPTTGGPLTPITLAGSGFDAGETVSLHLDSTTSTWGTLGAVPADGTGSFNVTLVVNQARIGPNSFFGTGVTSGKISIANFKVTPELAIFPATAAAGSAVSIQGFGFDLLEDVVVDQSGLEIGEELTNVSGSFFGSTAVGYTIPAGTSPGVYQISGKGRVSHRTASASLTVQ